MTTFVLIPGAGGAAWYWHLVVAELRHRGHEAIAVDIREDDPALGLPEYADAVVQAAAGRGEVVLVGQSMGGFTVPMAAQRLPVAAIVLVNAMIPVPGETPGQWWDATGQPGAKAASDALLGTSGFDEQVHFLHDVPPDVAAAGAGEQRAPSDTPFGQPCTFESWPAVPTRVLVGRDDRFFPAQFQVRVAADRLGITAEVLPGGHLLALARPVELTDALLGSLR